MQNFNIKLFSLKKKNSHLKGKHLTSTKEREREIRLENICFNIS
jgi:hypothetical protein